MTAVAPRLLLPLTRPPADDPEAWAAAAAIGPTGVAVLAAPGLLANHIPTDHAFPVGVAAAQAIPVPPEAAVAPDDDQLDMRAGLARLAAAGVRCLGHVSLGFGACPFAQVRADIAGWARLPAAGIFVDHVPAGPFQLGPVIQAVRAARRDGLRIVVLNPGVAVDSAYRRLTATLCTFEGSWSEYLSLPSGRCEPGDGHLIYGVPPGEKATAHELAAARGAGLVYLTGQAGPFIDPVDRAGAGPSRLTSVREGARG